MPILAVLCLLPYSLFILQSEKKLLSDDQAKCDECAAAVRTCRLFVIMVERLAAAFRTC